MCPEVRASLSVVSLFFVLFLWLWIVGGVGDVEACVMLSDAFLEDNVSDVFWVFFSVSHVTCFSD